MPRRTVAAAAPGPAPPPAHPALHAFNASTKWLVSGAAAATAAVRRDAAVGWAIVGAVAAAFLGKVIHEERDAWEEV